MLSKIERGQLFPTLPTLLRIALVFSVGLEYFFAGSRDNPVVGIVRRKDRPSAFARSQTSRTSLTSSSRSTIPPSSGR